MVNLGAGVFRMRKPVAAALIAAVSTVLMLMLAGTAFGVGATNVETIDAMGDNGKRTSVAFLDGDNPSILYSTGSLGAVKLATCSDPTCSFPSIEVIFEGAGRPATVSNLGFDSRGFPYFTYGVPFGADPGTRLVRCNDSRCARFTEESFKFPGAIALSADDRVVFSFSNKNGKLKYGQCINIACTSVQNFMTIDDRTGISGALGMGANDNPVMVYGNRGFLKVARCSDISCSAPTLETVDSVDFMVTRVSKVVDLMVDSNDHPVMVLATSDGTTLVLCSDPFCTSSTTRVIPSSSRAGDLALDDNGHPVYASRSSGTVRVARCQDVDCTNIGVEIVDDASGSAPSLTIDGNGYPAIAYNTNANESLKFAACGNADCVEYVGDFPEEGTYYLRSVATGRYLDADRNGGVGTSQVPKQDDEWTLELALPRTSQPFTLTNAEYETALERTPWRPEDAGDGTFYLRRISDASRNYLSTNGTGVVITDRDQSDSWEFVPVG